MLCEGTESKTRTGGWRCKRKILAEHKRQPCEEGVLPPLAAWELRLLAVRTTLAGLCVGPKSGSDDCKGQTNLEA